MSIRSISTIHSDLDRRNLIRSIVQQGFQIIDPYPDHRSDAVRLCTYDDAPENFYVTRPEWRFLSLSVYESTREDKVIRFVQPGVNFCGFEFYMPMKRTNGRLGSGDLSSNNEWLDSQRHTLFPCPSDVRIKFNMIRKEIRRNKSVTFGKHRYHVMPDALTILQSDLGKNFAPFPFMDDFSWRSL